MAALQIKEMSFENFKAKSADKALTNFPSKNVAHKMKKYKSKKRHVMILHR